MKRKPNKIKYHPKSKLGASSIIKKHIGKGQRELMEYK
jgi:hypothetical protein